MEGFGLALALWLGTPLMFISGVGVLWATFWHFAGVAEK